MVSLGAEPSKHMPAGTDGTMAGRHQARLGSQDEPDSDQGISTESITWITPFD